MEIAKVDFLRYLRGLIKRIEHKLPAKAPEIQMMEITFGEIRHVYTTEVYEEEKTKEEKNNVGNSN